MKILFDKNALLDATKWVVDIVDSKNDTATVRMDVAADGVKFSSMSMEGERSIKVDADVSGLDEPERFELHAAALKKIPSQVSSDVITFTYNPSRDKTKFVVDGGVRLNVPLVSSQNRSVHGVKGMVHVGDAVPADLFNTVKMLAVIADSSNDETLYTCIDFDADPERGRIKAMAIDGFAMSVREFAYNVASEQESRFLLTASDVKSMSAAMNATSVDIYTSDSAVAFVFDDGRTARVNQMNIPAFDYTAVMFVDRDDETFDFKTADLQSAVARLSAWNSEDDVELDIDPDASELTVQSNTGDWSMTIPLDGTSMNGSHHVSFPKIELNKTLKASDAEGLRGRFVRDAEGQDIVFTWDQLNPDGSVDDAVYLMTLPVVYEE